jgi:site-specific DNA recombinase
MPVQEGGKAMFRAVVYARVSSEKQIEGYSLKTQIEGCERYADSNDLLIIDRIEDPGFSGATLNRPGLNRVRKLAAQHGIDAVLIYARDRLARELIQDLALCAELRANGVAIHDVARNKVLTGDFSDHIDAIIAEEERRRIRERTVRGRHARVLEGKFPTHGKPPYGYCVEGSGKSRTIAVYPEEARYVTLIFRWYVLGDERGLPLSISQIAQKLSEMNVPTRADLTGRAKKRGYAKWDLALIASLLKQSAYRGIYYAYRLKKVDGKTVRTKPEAWHPIVVPAIIDNDLWEAAQRQMALNRTESKRRTLYNYLVRCRIKCRCGYSVGAKAWNPGRKTSPDNKYYAYVCYGRFNRTARSCAYGGLPFNARKVDELVWQWVVATMLDEHAVRQGYARLVASREDGLAVLEHERQIYQEQHQKCRQEIDTLLVLYRTSKIKAEFLDAHIEPLQDALDRLETAIAEVESRITELDIGEDDLSALLAFGVQIRDSVAEFNFEQRRHLIELLNVRVELAVENEQKVLYVSSRVDSARLILEMNQGPHGDSSAGNGSGATQERAVGGSFDLLTARSLPVARPHADRSGPAAVPKCACCSAPPPMAGRYTAAPGR